MTPMQSASLTDVMCWIVRKSATYWYHNKVVQTYGRPSANATLMFMQLMWKYLKIRNHEIVKVITLFYLKNVYLVPRNKPHA
ncbi:hypothetical protein PEC331060_02560 [Pectobacterium carotovorum subsp. carotovorum]|nr:hypothetical protein PEC331060_02560 [Pectobacterium carotovorum subsp. carotovorum]